jgi:predicted porin
MKLSHLSAMTILCVAAAAQAQAPSPAPAVTIYGLLDAGVEYVSNVGAAGKGNWRMPANTGTLPSRWGLRGTEPLGDGLAAVFTLEMGFAPGTGALGQGGRSFGRQAFVGLSSPYGTVTLGRQYTMLFWSLLSADILGPNVYGLGSFDAYIPNARTDNSLAWRGTFSGLTLGATFSLGRDTVNAGPSPVGTNCPGQNASDRQACREWSLLAKYDTARWGVAAAYDRLHGRTLGPAPDAVFGGLNSSDKTDSRLSLNGYVMLGSTKVGGGVIRRDNDGNAARPKSDLWHIGAAHPVTPALTIDGALQALRYKDVDNFDSTMLAVRATYSLSKRTALYGQVAHMSNDSSATVSVSGGAPGSNPAPGGSQNGLSVGIRHSF